MAPNQGQLLIREAFKRGYDLHRSSIKKKKDVTVHHVTPTCPSQGTNFPQRNTEE
jgi:ketol-acid reductoisomerase